MATVAHIQPNCLAVSWSKPLYVLSHSKAVLRDAIQRDASFLERNKIMDYSLLVGLDSKHNVLVLGIIGACVCVSPQMRQFI